MCYDYFFDITKVPDWIQAVGVVISAIGLVKTLRLQQETFRDQQRLTAIEQENFLQSRLPILEIERQVYNVDGVEVSVVFDITIRENYLQNLSITHDFEQDNLVEEEGFRIQLPYIISGVIFQKGFSMSFRIDYTLSGVIQAIEIYSGNTFSFKFQDAMGNKYQQLLIYKGGNNLFLHPAIRLRD